MRNRNRINICGIPHMGDTDRNSYYFFISINSISQNRFQYLTSGYMHMLLIHIFPVILSRSTGIELVVISDQGGPIQVI